MTSLPTFRGVAAQRLAQLRAWCSRRELFPGAYCVCLCAMFLTNSDRIPKDIYYVAVLPLGILVASSFALDTIRRSRILWAIALYLSLIGLSGLAQPGFRLQPSVAYFRHSLAVLSFLIATAYLVQDRKRVLGALFLTLCSAAAISAALNVAAFLAWTFNRHHPWAERLAASLGMPGYENSTNIGITYAVLMVAGLGTVAAGGHSRPQRFLLWVAAAMLLVALLLTQNHGAWLGATAGSLALALAQSRRRTQMLWGAAVLVVFILAATSFAGGLLARGDSYRFELWGRYLSMAADSPWLGYGLWTNIQITMRDGMAIVHPHNLLLSAQIRGGLLASLALLFAFWTAFRRSFRLSAAERLPVPFALMMTISVAALFDYELWGTAPEWPWVTFWLPLGLAVGAEMWISRAARSASSPQPLHG